jgi:arginyl-tRNA--protein-N-Asp/Glu arginylyltransferase
MEKRRVEKAANKNACRHCDQVFKTRALLRTHQSQECTKRGLAWQRGKSLRCLCCGKSFSAFQKL